MKKQIIILLLGTICSNFLFSQSFDLNKIMQMPQLPQIPGMQNPSEAQQRNQQLIRESEQLRKQKQAILHNQNYTKNTTILLPSFRNQPGTEFYRTAFAELCRMLNGIQPQSLKRAVFITENAYFGNKMQYELYDKNIQEIVRFCQTKMAQSKLNPNDEMAKKMMLFDYMTDTVSIKSTGKEKRITHYPLRYDFEDYAGHDDFRKTFVTKLLSEGSGQCTSLPLLYLILAEAMQTEAYWAKSPQHTFVKIQDDKGAWYNLELTSGVILSDYFYLNSGYIKAEALRNRIYMEPLSKTEAIAQCLTDLAKGYINKYGYDEFVRNCADTALAYFPNSLSAFMIKANYQTDIALYVIKKLGVPSMEKLPDYPQAYRLHKQMQDSYKAIDNLGYEDMPAQVYETWLKAIEKETQKPANQQKIHINQTAQ